MTIISSTSAITSMVKNKRPMCQCREYDFVIVLQLEEQPVRPSNMCHAGSKGTNRIAQVRLHWSVLAMPSSLSICSTHNLFLLPSLTQY